MASGERQGKTGFKGKRMIKLGGRWRQRQETEGKCAQRGVKAEVEDSGGGGQAPCILTGLYVCRSQLSSGSKVDPDEFSLGVDGTKSEEGG